ncbi:response regulator [bacterium]
MDTQHDIIQSNKSSEEKPLYPSTPIVPDLHEILKRLPDIIFCVDQQGVVRYVNHTEFKIEIAATAGTLLYDMMPSNCNKQLKPALDQAFESSQPQHFEYLSGVNQWWKISIHPMKIASKVEHAIVIFSEITHGKKFEDVIQFMELALKQASMEITITNPKGRIIYTNEESETELVGQIPEILQQEVIDTTNPKSEVWATIEKGEIWIDSQEFPDLFGDKHHYEISILPIQDTAGTITHYTIIQRDLTRLKTLENALHTQVEQLKETLEHKEKNTEILNQVIEELTQAKDDAAKMSQSSGELLAKMSHDIRTPLNSIVSMVHLIMETDLQPAQEKYLNVLKISANNLNVLINDILDFGKIEAGEVKIEMQPIQLDKMLCDLISTLAIQAEGKNLELILDIQPDIPNQVIGDSHRIQQIITNLLTNAIKFTDQGEILLRVQNEPIESDQAQIRFSVIDSGRGIPKELHESIFNAFVQDPYASQQNEGSGLGLTISAKLVEVLQGKIWIESPLNTLPVKGGQGCAIHMVLSFDIPETALEEKPIKLHEQYQEQPILIIEDNETQRKVIEKILVKHGTKPLGVESGRAALATLHQMLLQQSAIPLALIDVDLPNMDGFTLAEQILQDDELPESVIMMISPLKLKQDIERCTALGINHYLVKPINSIDLIQQLNILAKEITSSEENSAKINMEKDAQSENMSEEQKEIRILLVDDDESTRQFIDSYLSKQGWQVISVSNGKTAVEEIKKDAYHLILMDIKMPEMNGLETTVAIREFEQSHHRNPVPIVAVTARSLTDRQQCLDAGMTDYIVKPVQAEVLVQTINKYIHGFTEGSDLDSQTPINITKAMNTFNGDNRSLLEQIETFLENFMEKFLEFQSLISDRRMKLLEERAKDLKIKAGMIGAIPLYRWADQLETVAWKSDIEEAPSILEKLSEAYEDLKLFVEQSDLKETLQQGLKTLRILVIEDNLAYQEFLRKQLEAHGYEIILAKDGLEGLELARAEKPDLIILDLMLPQVNGHAVTHMLKLDRNCQQIPIMMLTCRNLEEDAELAHKGGANIFLLKSTPTEKILSEIKRLLDEKPHE